MVQKTIVTVRCDMGDEEGTETISFSYEGQEYEIDACSKHAEELHDDFTRYADKARRVSKASVKRRTGGGSLVSAPRVRDGRSEDIRTWAGENGYEVKPKGRISAGVIAAYDAAH